MLSAVGGLQEHHWQQRIGRLAQVSPGQGQKPGSKEEALMGLPGRGMQKHGRGLTTTVRNIRSCFSMFSRCVCNWSAGWALPIEGGHNLDLG